MDPFLEHEYRRDARQARRTPTTSEVNKQDKDVVADGMDR
jgi:hypothetical protein